MTALLPPDPSVSGHYWIMDRHGLRCCAEWHVEGYWQLERWGGKWDPKDLAALDWSLATPHRLPTAEELDAVYGLSEVFAELADELENAGDLNGSGAFDTATKRLRTALGGTP